MVGQEDGIVRTRIPNNGHEIPVVRRLERHLTDVAGRHGARDACLRHAELRSPRGRAEPVHASLYTGAILCYASRMLLHIYGQANWHDDAFIVGNEQGLLRLRAAIDRALANGTSAASAFPRDGEGYSTFVMKMSDKQMEQLTMPYCTLRSERGLHPVSAILLSDYDKALEDARLDDEASIKEPTDDES